MNYRHQCPWCKAWFYWRDGRPDDVARDQHIEENKCGLVPRREREVIVKSVN